jgi:hypothetical protein
MTPEWVAAMIRHLEHATHVGGLLTIEEEVGLGRVVVEITLSLQKAKGHKGVEKVARRTRVQAKASADRIESFRAAGKLGKDTHLDSAH